MYGDPIIIYPTAIFYLLKGDYRASGVWGFGDLRSKPLGFRVKGCGDRGFRAMLEVHREYMHVMETQQVCHTMNGWNVRIMAQEESCTVGFWLWPRLVESDNEEGEWQRSTFQMWPEDFQQLVVGLRPRLQIEIMVFWAAGEARPCGHLPKV